MVRLILAVFLIGATALLADEPKKKVELSADLKKIFELLNEARKKEKLPALMLNTTLTKVAKSHTENMAKQEKMEHELDKKRAKDRVIDAGYEYRFVGENLANSPGEIDDPAPKPESIHKGWMESKRHRDNILSPDFTEVGLAMVKSKKGTYYYTQVFAAPVTIDLDKLLALLNEARKKEKLPPLTRNSTLNKAALSHTENMAKQEKMDHELDGKLANYRVTKAGYDYKVVGENLFCAEMEEANGPPPNPAEVHKAWMDSEGHRKNILSPRFTQVGLAMVRSKKGTYYYTQVFATPRK
jgi:uncharacterized protein YkwD